MNDVLIVEDDAVLCEALAEAMSLAGHSYLTAKNGREALLMLEQHNPALILSDSRFDAKEGVSLLAEIGRRRPSVPVIIMTTRASVDDAVHAMRQGAVDYLQKPFSANTLVEKINHYIKRPISDKDKQPIAEDPKSQALFAMALRVAKSDAGVMISGESGTGKEVLAHFIHQHSPRAHEPFIAINCAAIPEHMLEATLFGYEKGSFTGAYKSSSGKFEQAQNGTLLLDEVSEMSMTLQAKLLRVLQEKEVERIGANKSIDLNVRILATSNRQLLDEVKLGRFREDLYYRLNIFPLHWMPLRERVGDIIPLAKYLLCKHAYHHLPILPVFSEQALAAMQAYSWPGNARELENVVQRALILQVNNVIEPEHLHISHTKAYDAPIDTSKETRNLQHHEFDMIEQTLKTWSGNRQQVAAILGVSERTLRYKLAKMREEGYVV